MSLSIHYYRGAARSATIVMYRRAAPREGAFGSKRETLELSNGYSPRLTQTLIPQVPYAFVASVCAKSIFDLKVLRGKTPRVISIDSAFSAGLEKELI